MIWSRISKPASSIAHAILWYVRVPPKASRCPPGLRTLRQCRQSSVLYAMPVESQALPMKPSSYGGSVTIESKLCSGCWERKSMQFPMWSIRSQ